VTDLPRQVIIKTEKSVVLMKGFIFAGMDNGYPWITTFENAHRFRSLEKCVAWVRMFQKDLEGFEAVMFDTIILPVEPVPVQDLIDAEVQFEAELAALYAKHGKAAP